MQAQSVSAHKQLEKLVDDNSANWKQVSKQIWGFCRTRATRREELISVVIATEGSGSSAWRAGWPMSPPPGSPPPATDEAVIAILGEFDARCWDCSPNKRCLSVPQRRAVRAVPAGIISLRPGAALAAVAVKQYLEANHIGGARTLRYYGTPAGGGRNGKVYMVRAGLFKDVDVVLLASADGNDVTNGDADHHYRGQSRVHGVAAHAAMAAGS